MVKETLDSLRFIGMHASFDRIRSRISSYDSTWSDDYGQHCRLSSDSFCRLSSDSAPRQSSDSRPALAAPSSRDYSRRGDRSQTHGAGDACCGTNGAGGVCCGTVSLPDSALAGDPRPPGYFDEDDDSAGEGGGDDNDACDILDDESAASCACWDLNLLGAEEDHSNMADIDLWDAQGVDFAQEFDFEQSFVIVR